MRWVGHTVLFVVHKPMIESGLGSALMGGGLSDELKQATFSIGLKGVAPEDVPKVEDLAIATLKQAASDGFEADAIEASLNTIEVGRPPTHASSPRRGDTRARNGARSLADCSSAS